MPSKNILFQRSNWPNYVIFMFPLIQIQYFPLHMDSLKVWTLYWCLILVHLTQGLSKLKIPLVYCTLKMSISLWPSSESLLVQPNMSLSWIRFSQSSCPVELLWDAGQQEILTINQVTNNTATQSQFFFVLFGLFLKRNFNTTVVILSY